MGAVGLTVQALLLRELMTAWRGNEMSFGIALAVWLASGGIGSSAYGLFSGRLRPTRTSLSAALAGLGVLAPASLLAARALRGAMGLASGEIAGFAPLIAASAVSLVPFTLLAGFTFALATSVLRAETGRDRTAAGEVYLLEAAGAALGGLALSFALLPRAGPVAIALIASALSVSAGAWLVASGSSRRRRAFATAQIAAAVLAVLAVTTPLADRLDDASVESQWKDVGFVSQTNSIYGRIVTAGAGSQKSVYESGVLAASVPDRLAAEETAHIPMLVHPSPRRVLLLGGGLGGAVAEILKHPTVSSVDYVELDPELIRESRRAFGDAMTEGLDDPRVTVHFADARFFVKRAGAGERGRTYDVVILGTPDPTTALLNRFYTVEFLKEVAAVLNDGGVVGMSVQSAENYVGSELAVFLATLRSTARAVFPAVTLHPGDPCHIVAAREGAELTRDPDVLSERVRERELDVVYVRDYYLSDRLSERRVEYLDSSLRDVDAPANTDLFPSAYYLSMVLWNRQFAGAPDLLLAAPRFVSEAGAAVVGAIMVALLGASALLRARSERRKEAGGPLPEARWAVAAAVIVVGATEISLELTALLAFQSIYGYVYHQLALIIAAFMAGLAAGGWLGTRAVNGGAGWRSFALLQLGIAAVPLALSAALARLNSLPPDALTTWAPFFPLIVVASALLAGTQFPIAVGLLSHSRSDAGALGGRLYGADLMGAALGATGTGVFLLPIMGVAGAMRALTILNAAVLVSLVLLLPRPRRAAAP